MRALRRRRGRGILNDENRPSFGENQETSSSILICNVMLSEDEIALRLKSKYPAMSLDEIKEFVSGVDLDIKRQSAQQIIADSMQYHIAMFHRSHSDSYRYHVDYKAEYINKLMLQAGYLARYYSASSIVLEDKANV